MKHEIPPELLPLYTDLQRALDELQKPLSPQDVTPAPWANDGHEGSEL